jgi:hypothetical protein
LSVDTPPKYEPPVVEDIETERQHATTYTATGLVLRSGGVPGLAAPLNSEAANE